MSRLLTLAVALVAAACGGAEPPAATDPAEVASMAASPGTVDSVFPMPVMIERFQAGTPRQPAALREDAATSMDSLIVRFVRAVEDSSANDLRSLRLDVSEWAWLYFPTSHFADEPYRQPPALGWMLTEQNGLKGENRLLRRFGGGTLEYGGYDCPDPPVVEGPNRLWRKCTVTLRDLDRPLRLFGTVLERDGRFAFISLANEL